MLCTVPGDPFAIDFDNQTDPFLIDDQEDPSDEINFTFKHLSTTTLKAIPIENFTSINLTTTDKPSSSFTPTPVLDTLPIYKKQ